MNFLTTLKKKSWKFKKRKLLKTSSDLQISAEVAAPHLALMAPTLGTGSLATGNFGNRRLATGNLVDWHMTDNLLGKELC